MITNTPLYSYIIASADMRYIEVGEREIYLRSDPELGLVVRGEMPGCGPNCYVDLSRILLEYALTCEGCENQEEAAESAGIFGVRLGRLLAQKLCDDQDGLTPVENAAQAFKCIFNSMEVSYRIEHSPGQIRFSFDESLLHKTARNIGTSRGISNAQRSFVALCKTMLRILAPEMTLQEPTDCDFDRQVFEVVIKQP